MSLNQLGPHTMLSSLAVVLLSIGPVNHALCLDTSSLSHLGARELGVSVEECGVTNCVNAFREQHECYANCTVSFEFRSEYADYLAHHANVSTRSRFELLPHSQCSARPLMKYSSNQWSPANSELFLAVVKISILVFLKIIIKYYIRGFLKAHIASKAIFELIELASKALTIAIAKLAIKWVLYSALRTAAKTFLIASLRSLLKPFTSPLLKSSKGKVVGRLVRALRFTLSLSVKVIIKTVALELLVLVFENEATQLPLHQLMFRVSLILLVKMSAKRVCKMGKVKSQHNAKDIADPVDNSAPVDKMMMFAIQKLVTKLVKIPLIKILL